MFKTSIVVPCYNEGSRLDLDEFRRYIQAQADVDFCFVDDGSRDNTFELVSKFAAQFPERVRVEKNAQNMGKAEAVRTGVMASLSDEKYDFVGYFDADLSTPLSQIKPLRLMLESNPQTLFVLGSRFRHMGAQIERNELRHYLGRVFSTFASMIVELPVYDTQCGAKLIRAQTARYLFEKPFLSRWLFDVELLARLIVKNGRSEVINQVVEVPLQVWIEKGDSRLNFKSLIRVPLELLRIRKKYFRS